MTSLASTTSLETVRTGTIIRRRRRAKETREAEPIQLAPLDIRIATSENGHTRWAQAEEVAHQISIAENQEALLKIRDTAIPGTLSHEANGSPIGLVFRPNNNPGRKIYLHPANELLISEETPQTVQDEIIDALVVLEIIDRETALATIEAIAENPTPLRSFEDSVEIFERVRAQITSFKKQT